MHCHHDRIPPCRLRHIPGNAQPDRNSRRCLATQHFVIDCVAWLNRKSALFGDVSRIYSHSVVDTLGTMSSSTAATAAIESAFTRLKSSITTEDAREFGSTTLKDVRQAALDIQAAMRQRGFVRNMAKIEPFFKAMDIYSKPLDVLCNGTPFLPWIWVSQLGQLGHTH